MSDFALSILIQQSDERPTSYSQSMNGEQSLEVKLRLVPLYENFDMQQSKRTGADAGAALKPMLTARSNGQQPIQGILIGAVTRAARIIQSMRHFGIQSVEYGPLIQRSC